MDSNSEKAQQNRRDFIKYFGYTPEEGARRQAQADTFRPNRSGGNIYRRLQAEGKEARDEIDPVGEM
jgi:hypothetical protein